MAYRFFTVKHLHKLHWQHIINYKVKYHKKGKCDIMIDQSDVGHFGLWHSLRLKKHGSQSICSLLQHLIYISIEKMRKQRRKWILQDQFKEGISYWPATPETATSTSPRPPGPFM